MHGHCYGDQRQSGRDAQQPEFGALSSTWSGKKDARQKVSFSQDHNSYLSDACVHFAAWTTPGVTRSVANDGLWLTLLQSMNNRWKLSTVHCLLDSRDR
eukprot:834376-Amphidinium_carterae.2